MGFNSAFKGLKRLVYSASVENDGALHHFTTSPLHHFTSACLMPDKPFAIVPAPLKG